MSLIEVSRRNLDHNGGFGEFDPFGVPMLAGFSILDARKGVLSVTPDSKSHGPGQTRVPGAVHEIYVDADRVAKNFHVCDINWMVLGI